LTRLAIGAPCCAVGLFYVVLGECNYPAHASTSKWHRFGRGPIDTFSANESGYRAVVKLSMIGLFREPVNGWKVSPATTRRSAAHEAFGRGAPRRIDSPMAGGSDLADCNGAPPPVLISRCRWGKAMRGGGTLNLR
jgi:hypothetical protein